MTTDGQCLAIDGRWERRGSMDLYRPGATHGALYRDGVRFDGIPPAEDPTGCTVHSHTSSYRPTASGRVALQLWAGRSATIFVEGRAEVADGLYVVTIVRS